MATLKWPYSLADLRTKGVIVRKPGLVGWWPAGTNPEYPDDPAGTTYFQDAWATVDGWIVPSSRGSVSVAGGELVHTWVTGNGTPGQMVKLVTLLAGNTYRVKLRASRSMAVNLYYLRTSTGLDTVISTITVPVQGAVFDVTVPEDGTRIGIQNNSPQNGDTLSAKFVYVGTGAYLPNSLLDLSGNANHGMIYGATPVETPYGRGLSGDGVNDYCTFSYPYSTAHTLAIWYKGTFALSDTNYSLFILNRTSVAGASRIKILIYGGKAYARWVDNASVARNLDSGVLVNDSDYHLIVLTHTGALVSIYVDGVLCNTAAGTLTSAYVTTGAFFSGTAGLYTSGTIAQPRIFNYALTPAEVLDMYLHPELYEALPLLPMQGNYNESGPDGALHTTFEAGVQKTRQRWTSTPTYLNPHYILTSIQKQELDYFYKYLAKAGGIRFDWNHPEYGTVEARFRGRPTYDAVKNYWDASVPLEVFL